MPRIPGERCYRISGVKGKQWGLTWPWLGSLGAPETLLRPSTYTTSQQAWSSLCRLLPALMTLPGQSDHIRLDTRPGPGITPTLDTHTHTLSSLLAKLRKVTAAWDPGQKEEEKGGRARHKEYCLGVGPHHLIGRPAVARSCLSSPIPGKRGTPMGCWGRGWTGQQGSYCPACQPPTSHPEA